MRLKVIHKEIAEMLDIEERTQQDRQDQDQGEADAGRDSVKKEDYSASERKGGLAHGSRQMIAERRH
jgi:hypothetical protein